MTPQEIKDQASTHTDHDKLESYMRMYDRILLYTLASNLMPKESIDETINLWEKVIKKTIDSDATMRTKFMESTPTGRIAKLREEPDGEDLRLHSIKTWNLAKNIISANMHNNNNNNEESDEPNY